MEKKDWEEFRKTGLLFLINTILHAFGWSIVIEKEGNRIVSVYPARVKFSGFNEKTQKVAYKRIQNYIKRLSQEFNRGE